MKNPIIEKDKIIKSKNRMLTSQNTVIEPTQDIESRDFSWTDLHNLSLNEHYRFMPHSKKVGHAVVGFQQGESFSYQFQAPTDRVGGHKASSIDFEMPLYRSLDNIKLLKRFGHDRAEANTPNGTKMVGMRSYDLQLQEDEATPEFYRLWCFSPELNHMWKENVFWGGGQLEPPLFSKDLSKKETKDLQKEEKEIGKIVKNLHVEVDKASVLKREKQSRIPSQNQVMGQSAIDAFEEFYAQYKDEVSPQLKEKLKKSIKARPYYRGAALASQVRPEWLHLVGHVLMPMDKEPQSKDNLSAAPKYINTAMMPVERVAKWHAMHRPKSTISVDTKFEMLRDSDIMKKGTLDVTIKEGTKKVVVSKDFYPFEKYPKYTKATDVAQTTLAVHGLLTNKPKIRTKVSFENIVGSSSFSSDSFGCDNCYVGEKEMHANMNVKQTGKGKKKGSAGKKNVTKKLKKSISPSISFPIVSQFSDYQQSVVCIRTTAQYGDYADPWKGSSPAEFSGSGVVFSKHGKKYILTNAHVVEDQVYVRVRLANDNQLYTARKVETSYQADLAILEVQDRDFLSQVVPMEFGEMTKISQKVSVVGFPIGGEEISTTKGIVSRIEVGDFTESGEEMLQVQTDSAINPGNSGGPVFSKGKIVGIAFQGISSGDGLGYFIPTPVINHFLQDVFSPGPYKGFPTLHVDTQSMNNSMMRQYYGMKKGQTGVRIMRIDDLSDAKGKLFKDDILLTIDGFQVSNDFKVNVPNVGARLSAIHLFHQKQLGETVDLTVLRRAGLGKKPKIVKVPVTLKWRAGQIKRVIPIEHEKEPTFYFNSGICFQPLTNNYLETSKGGIIREYIIPKIGYIHDVPKTSIEQEYVIINSILNSDHTVDYALQENGIVKSINGHDINNIQDVVFSMESNENDYHRIIMMDNNIIIVKNFSSEEHAELLNRYRISKPYSNDIEDYMAHNNITPVDKLKKKKPRKNNTQELRTGDENSSSEKQSGILNILKQFYQKAEPEPSDGEILFSEFSDSEEDCSSSDYEEDGFVTKGSSSPILLQHDWKKKQALPKRSTMPGVSHFLGTVHNIEKKARAQYNWSSDEEDSMEQQQPPKNTFAF